MANMKNIMLRLSSYVFILISSLIVFPTSASARLADMHFVEEVRGAKYAVVAKPVKIEVFWCGLNVRVEVIEDLKGNAPNFIDIGIVSHPDHPVLADGNSKYFMVINEGKVRYGYNQMVPTYKNKEEEDRAKQKVAECDAKLPDQNVNHWIMNKITGSKWLKRPIYLAVPDHIESLVYYSKGEIEFIRGSVKEIEGDVFAFDPKKDGGSASLPREKFQGLGDPNGDLVPLEVQYGDTYYNWLELRKVWQDAENICDPEHENYNQELCKLQNVDYRRQNDEKKRRLEKEKRQPLEKNKYWKNKGCKCLELPENTKIEEWQKLSCKKACGMYK